MTDRAGEPDGVARHEAQLLEERFLAAVAENAARLAAVPPRPGGRGIPAAKLRRRLRAFDRTDEVKRLMADRALYDREVLAAMPTDRASLIEFSRRRLFGRRKVAGVLALVVNPLEALVAEDRAVRPASLAEAAERVRGLLPRDGAFHYVGAFSPTGWEAADLDDIPAGEGYELYLVEKGDGTEWLVRGRGAMRHLFNPESEADRLARCRVLIRARRGETMLSGLTVEAVAAAERVDRPVAEAALRQAARDDDHLALARIDGVLRLVHTERPTPAHDQEERPGSRAGAAEPDSSHETQRSDTMGLWERLLQWLRVRKKAPEPQTLIHELEQRRARLQVQRDDLDARIEDLEKTQRDLGQELQGDASPTRRVGLAQKIANVRRRVKQMQRRMTLYDKAIAVHNTHIDNLTIAAETREFRLPSEEEMKTIAVEVDEAVEAINDRADLALGLETAAAADTVDPEVEAILAEFGVAEPKAKAPPARERPAAARPEAAQSEPRAETPAPEPPQRRPAPPETD